jgi:Mn2+/Fe2+ NRAMP family transporter
MAVDNINQHKSFVQNRRSSLLAAIFLMATSAIGPGFITQTATFTATLGVAFAFGILASILIDFVVQQNIWRVVTLTQMNAAEVANRAIRAVATCWLCWLSLADWCSTLATSRAPV